MQQAKIAQAQELLRQAFAILNDLEVEAKARAERERAHFENMALLTEHPKPGPVISVKSEIQRIPEAPELDE